MHVYRRGRQITAVAPTSWGFISGYIECFFKSAAQPRHSQRELQLFPSLTFASTCPPCVTTLTGEDVAGERRTSSQPNEEAPPSAAATDYDNDNDDKYMDQKPVLEVNGALRVGAKLA